MLKLVGKIPFILEVSFRFNSLRRSFVCFCSPMKRRAPQNSLLLTRLRWRHPASLPIPSSRTTAIIIDKKSWRMSLIQAAGLKHHRNNNDDAPGFVTYCWCLVESCCVLSCPHIFIPTNSFKADKNCGLDVHLSHHGSSSNRMLSDRLYHQPS